MIHVVYLMDNSVRYSLHADSYRWFEWSPRGFLQQPGPRLPALPLPPLTYPPPAPEIEPTCGSLPIPTQVACIGESFKLSSLGYPSGVSLIPHDPAELHLPPLPIIFTPLVEPPLSSSSKVLLFTLSHCLETLPSLFRRTSSPRMYL